MTVLVTGAAGNIGRIVGPALRRKGLSVRLTDLAPINEHQGWHEVFTADLRELCQATTVMRGASAVVHLAAISDEAPFPDVASVNILATFNVLEAARRCHVQRVVLASSHHVTGLYPCTETITPDDPTRPDTFYGVSKVATEALGSLYARKYGLEVVCLRIGSFREHPCEPRHQATWLSHEDGVQLFLAALGTPQIPNRFLTVYGTSANPHSWWSRRGWNTLGYEPEDRPSPSLSAESEELQGGSFAAKEPQNARNLAASDPTASTTSP